MITPHPPRVLQRTNLRSFEVRIGLILSIFIRTYIKFNIDRSKFMDICYFVPDVEFINSLMFNKWKRQSPVALRIFSRKNIISVWLIMSALCISPSPIYNACLWYITVIERWKASLKSALWKNSVGWLDLYSVWGERNILSLRLDVQVIQ